MVHFGELCVYNKAYVTKIKSSFVDVYNKPLGIIYMIARLNSPSLRNRLHHFEFSAQKPPTSITSTIGIVGIYTPISQLPLEI